MVFSESNQKCAPLTCQELVAVNKIPLLTSLSRFVRTAYIVFGFGNNKFNRSSGARRTLSLSNSPEGQVLENSLASCTLYPSNLMGHDPVEKTCLHAVI